MDHSSKTIKPLLQSLNPDSVKPDVVPEKVSSRTTADDSSYYDFDLAEFPWALFAKSDRPTDNGPIVYEDTIKNPDTGEEVTRRFETFPCPEFGHATASTYELAYILIQLYIGDDCQGDRITFGSLKNLARMRGLQISGQTLKTIKRDLEILGGMKIKSYNAFWDSEKKAYGNMMGWRFFGPSVYFMPTAKFMLQEELALSYIEVSPIFQKIAATRGLFGLGFAPDFFISLKPLEQRLAVYLARRFKFQRFVRHRVEKVCTAIPITAKRSDNRRAKLKETIEGLITKGYPLLSDYTIEKKGREWFVHFHRKKKPTPDVPFWTPKDFAEMTEHEQSIIDEIVALTDDDGSKLWFLRCLREIGEHPMRRAMGNFKELYIVEKQPIKKSKGAVLTGIVQSIAGEMGVEVLRKQ